MAEVQQKESRVWYLFPIFFNIFGGLISYFILRGKDRQLAKNCLMLGLALLIIQLIAGVFWAGYTSYVEHLG